MPGILLWRSITQWLGGMGFIVLGVAILPYLGVGGMQLFRLESPGPTADRLRPRIRETAKLLWFVYAMLTVVLVMLFRIGGMSIFDAVNHALTTCRRAASPRATTPRRVLAVHPVDDDPVHVSWPEPASRSTTASRTADCGRTCAIRNGASTQASSWPVQPWSRSDRDDGAPLEQTVREALFQVVSIVTTTGYGTADYTLWAPGAQVALFLLFFLGGMAGSTGGRHEDDPRAAGAEAHVDEIRKQLHPRAVFVPKVSGRPVREQIMLNVLGFVLLYMMLFGLGTFAMALLGLSLPAAAGAAATAISNVGPALAELGPAEHFGGLPWQGHAILTVLMIVGRLEIYTVLLLFHPALWKR
jgi:trk system potassium uptake protein